MAYETGTATNYLDLLTKLKTFLTTNSTLVAASQNWTEMRAITALPFSGTLNNGRIAFGFSQYLDTNVDPWPSNVLSTDDVRMKITGNLIVPSTGSYQFVLSFSEWVEVRIDGTLVYSNYTSGAGTYVASYPSTAMFTRTLSSGSRAIDIRLMSVNTSERGLALAWKKPGDSGFATIPSTSYSSLALAWAPTYGSGSGTAANFAAIMNDSECVLRGPGLSSTDQIFVGLNTISSASSDFYNLQVSGAIGYSATLPANKQPGYEPLAAKGMFLWNSSIKYWFVASGRRFIVIAKVSTTYQDMYAGFFLPYGLPSEFPYPLAIGGSGVNIDQSRFSNTSEEHSSFWQPRIYHASGGHLSIRDNAGIWRPFQNLAGDDNQGKIYPQSGSSGINLRGSPSNDYGLIPLTLFSTSALQPNVWGELDGIYYIPGAGNASENLVTISSQNYLVAQSGFRTTNFDYAALKLA